MAERPLPENTFIHMNSDGNMEVVDIMTGRVLAVQKSREDILFGDKNACDEIVSSTGERVWVEKTLGENPTINRYRYTAFQGAAICHLIAEGKSIREIAQTPGFPPIQVMRAWRRQNPEFEDAIQIAKKDRAEFYQDKALGAVSNVVSKDDASAAKVKLEAYRWAASVDDPDTFGNKTKISGDPNAPLTLMIDTGIRRSQDLPPGEDALTVTPLLEKIPDVKIKDEEDGESVGEDIDLAPEEIGISQELPGEF